MNICLRRGVLIFAGVALGGLILGEDLAPAHAGSYVFVTPPGSMVGGRPVNVEADITTLGGSIDITLKNLQANPTDVTQLLSDLKFTVDANSSLGGSTELSSAGQEITVNGDGTVTPGSTVATGWVYTTPGGTGLLDVLAGPGHAGPTHLIIGPPGPGGTYSNANGSIAGNSAHNPFLNQSATFTILAPAVTADTVITSVTFSFGTTAGIDVVGQVVPEPNSLVLGLVGLGLAGTIGFSRKRRRA